MSVRENTNWDINKYRQAHESEEHWYLKREFMEAHKGRIHEDRLVCLAQLYQNIELLGCRYPDETMRQVAELGREICLDYKESKKTKLQRTFVKASDAAGARARGGRPNYSQGTKRKNDESSEDMTLNQVAMTSNRGRRRGNSSIINPNTRNLESLKRSYNSFHTSQDFDPSQEDDQFAPPYHNPPEQDPWSMEGPAAPGGSMAPHSSGAISSNISATVQKYENATRQRTPKVLITAPEPSPSGRELSSKFQRSEQPQGERMTSMSSQRSLPMPSEDYWQSTNPLARLIITEQAYHQDQISSINVLNSSCSLSRIKIEYKFAPYTDKKLAIVLNGIHVASGEGETKRDAKTNAATSALNELKKYCYTIRVLKMHDTEDFLSLQEVEESSSGMGMKQQQQQQMKTGLDTPIEDSSIGNKLLKLMGWSGGGLGKRGTGITEPIRPVSVLGRDGLGKERKMRGGATNASNGHAFRQKLDQIVREFANSSGLGELIFSSEFTKEQRATIHKIANRYKLKNTSYGKGDDRYLVLSRKITGKNLLRTLLEMGPTEKYEVIPPSSFSV